MLIGFFHGPGEEDASAQGFHVDGRRGPKAPARRVRYRPRVKPIQVLGGSKAGGDAIPDAVINPAAGNKVKANCETPW